MSKQEVIEILYNALRLEFRRGIGSEKIGHRTISGVAEALYDRIAPLIREDIGGWTTWVERASDAITERVLERIAPGRDFPEDNEIRKILYDYGRVSIDRWAGNEETLPPCRNYIDDLKRLWEGGHIGEVGKSVGLRPDAQDERNRQASRGLARIEAGKKVCQTCRGTKKVPVDNCCSIDCDIPSHRVDCPDCTGETPAKASNAGGWQLDRRSGEDQRKDFEMIVCYNGVDIYIHPNRCEAYKDCRIEDRRNKQS